MASITQDMRYRLSLLNDTKNEILNSTPPRGADKKLDSCTS